MTILITGATGLIGSALTDTLLQNGHRVHYLTTRHSAIREKANVKGYFWDPKEGILDDKALDGVEVIVHLAGATIAKRWTEPYKKVILESRTRTAQILFDALESGKGRVKHFVSASGISYYPSSLTATYHEDHATPDDSFLGQVVQAWEDSANAFSKLGIKVAVVRTGLVLSSDDGALSKIAGPVRWGAGAPLGSGRQWQSWVHIEDVARIYQYIISHERKGVFNAVAPYPVTNSQLTKAIARELGKPLLLPNVPGFVLKAIFGQMAVLLLEGQRVLPTRLEELGYTFKFPNIESALSNIFK